MVEQQAASDTALDSVFRALGDPTRRAMLTALQEREHTISDLAAPFSMSLAGASKHVKVLEGAGLVRREKRGREQICALEASPLAEAHAWLERYAAFWTARIDVLEQLLGDERAARSAESRSAKRQSAKGKRNE